MLRDLRRERRPHRARRISTSQLIRIEMQRFLQLGRRPAVDLPGRTQDESVAGSTERAGAGRVLNSLGIPESWSEIPLPTRLAHASGFTSLSSSAQVAARCLSDARLHSDGARDAGAFERGSALAWGVRRLRRGSGRI
jgi:hypothetical protein